MVMTREIKAAFAAMESALDTGWDSENDPGSELVQKLFEAFQEAVWYVTQESEAPT